MDLLVFVQARNKGCLSVCPWGKPQLISGFMVIIKVAYNPICQSLPRLIDDEWEVRAKGRGQKTVAEGQRGFGFW